MRDRIDVPFPPPLGQSIEIITSDACQQVSQFAVDDFEERLHAMTAHHLDLSLLDLTTSEPVFWMFQGKLLCHPANVAHFRNALEMIR